MLRGSYNSLSWIWRRCRAIQRQTATVRRKPAQSTVQHKWRYATSTQPCWRSVRTKPENWDTAKVWTFSLFVLFSCTRKYAWRCSVVNGRCLRNILGVSWIVGNAENLAEIESDSYDAYTIAFGIRNCTNIDKVVPYASSWCFDVRSANFQTSPEVYRFTDLLSGVGGSSSSSEAWRPFHVSGI